MGLLMRPSRPLARLAVGAAVGGAASRAGKVHTRQETYDDHASQVHDATPVGAAVAPAPEAPPVRAAAGNETGELERLAKLHESGALTDAEFSAAKARVLGV